MKHTRLLIFFFFILGVVSPTLAGQMLTSKIDQVTLFSDQALIQRVAEAEVGAGQLALQLEVTAFSVDRDSLTAKINGSGEIHGVKFKQVPVSESPQADLRVLEETLEDLEKNQRRLTDEKNVLSRKTEFLNGIIEFSKTQTATELKTKWPEIADLENTLGFLGNQYQSIFSAKQTLDAKLKVLTDKIDVIKRQIAAIHNRGPKTRQIIEVLFKSTKLQNIRVTAQYLVKRATWQPLYRLMVPGNLDKADLNLFAQIDQKTGENWDQVILSVSNAVPLKGIGVPQLYTWEIDLPRPADTVRYKSASRDRLMAESKIAMAPPPAPAPETAAEAEFVSARKKASALSFTYELPQPVSIPSGAQETLAPLFSRQMAGEYFHLTVPKQQSTVYMVGSFKADRELLAGLLNVYFSGQYVGKTYLEEKMAASDFRLNLGADRGILVKREKIRDKRKESFFGTIERGTVVRELAYRINIENLKQDSVKLQVLDNLPVSRTDKITVKDISLTPEPAVKNHQDRQGVMLWKIDLKPLAKAKIDIAYVVTYPKDSEPDNL